MGNVLTSETSPVTPNAFSLSTYPPSMKPHDAAVSALAIVAIHRSVLIALPICLSSPCQDPPQPSTQVLC